jgi:hypothetical protein
MPAKKIVSDYYTIKSPTIELQGNLIVTGTETKLQSIESTVNDRIITLNKLDDDTMQAGVLGGDSTSGIEVDRGTLTTAYLKFRESDDAWILNNGDGTARYILTSVSSSSGAGLTAVVEDLQPELGGNLSLAGNTIKDTDANVEIKFNTVAGGGTGIFVTNDSSIEKELVTKRKAFIYALIF